MPPALKLLIPLAVLVGGVFALTYFSLHAPTDPATGLPGFEVEGPVDAPTGRPLVFFTTSRRWDPQSPSMPDRAFQGFYDIVSEEKAKKGDFRPEAAHFWFENRNDQEVTLQLRGVSCTACSGGRLAPIPPEVTRQLLQTAFATALPQGLTTGLSAAGLAGPAAHLDAARPTLAWQEFKFKEHTKDFSRVQFTVPAAKDPDGWDRQWGVLELNFVVGTSPSVPLTADFLSRVGATDRVGADRFSIFYRPAPPIEVDQPKIEFSDLSPSAAERRSAFVAFSVIHADIPPPAVRVDLPAGAPGEPGEWVTAGPAVKLTPAELEAFAAAAAASQGEPVRVAAAYRIPVVARAAVGDRPADIGKLERVISVVAGGETRRVRVAATVRGPVYLSGEAKELGFGTFRVADGATVTAFLTTERPGTVLTWVRDETTPKYLAVQLDPQPAQGEFGRYRIRVTVPKNEQLGELSGEVVLEATAGPLKQRVRIPVAGRAAR